MDDTEEDLEGENGKFRAHDGYEREKSSERDGDYSKGYSENEGDREEDDNEDAPVEIMEEDVDDDDDDDDGDGVQRIVNNDVNDADGVDDKSGYMRRVEEIDYDRHPKKRRLQNLVSNYEFAPRVPHAQAQPVACTDIVVAASSHSTPVTNKLYAGGRNGLSDWTEHETFSLLDAWGYRFLQHGRKSLRSEEWQEVAEKVSHVSRFERTDTQCRNRLDTLKKKYKKEKAKFGSASGQSSKWIYFKKMDVLLSPPVKQPGLSFGKDSREYVFSNPRVYLNRVNRVDKMYDSAGHSDSTEDDSDGLPPKKEMTTRIVKNDTRACEGKKRLGPMHMLADSLDNFSKIYERTENNKRQELVKLEKMRMDFQRDLEQQKKSILERAQAEITKIWEGDDEENGASAENISN